MTTPKPPEPAPSDQLQGQVFDIEVDIYHTATPENAVRNRGDWLGIDSGTVQGSR